MRLLYTFVFLASIVVEPLAWAAEPSADPPPQSPKTIIDAVRGDADSLNASSDSECLDPDRPHLPEASTAVGKGHLLVEGGHTHRDWKLSSSQTYPEALLRIGLFADWFEVRVGQSFVSDVRTASMPSASSTGRGPRAMRGSSTMTNRCPSGERS